MRKIISEKGRKTIEAFVKENLSGRVNDSTIQAYIDMAKSNMDIHGGLPSLEISMCFSLTGDEECLELEKDDVAYEDRIFENADELCAVFGKEILNKLEKAGVENQAGNSGKNRETSVTVSYDGYDFRIFSVKKSGEENKSVPDFYQLEFLEPQTENALSD